MKEKELEDRLEANLDKIENGLVLIERQKRIKNGIIDLFCKDKNGKYVILEVKRKASARVITQLAKYNMELIKSGINKKKLRTLLIALEFPKDVRNICEFFKFEIKNVPKRMTYDKKILKNKFSDLDKERLIKFIKRKSFVNQAMAARFLDMQTYATRDLLQDLSSNNLITITPISGQKFIQLKKS